MNKQSKKGFTLIELLVVIAIVGILSGLLIVSMSGATNSAKDARIKADLDELRSMAQIYATNNPTYGYSSVALARAGLGTASCGVGANDFMSSGDAQSLCTDIYNQQQTNGYPTIYATIDKYCIQKTNMAVAGAWCVDYTGYAGTNNGCTATYTCATGD